MGGYVSKAKNLYSANQIDIVGFIGLIWAGIKYSSRDEHVVERATTAFLELYEATNHSPVKGNAIITHAMFHTYHNPNSHGLWPWLKKKGRADVILQQKNAEGDTVYSVKDDYYDALRKVCLCFHVQSGVTPPAPKCQSANNLED